MARGWVITEKAIAKIENDEDGTITLSILKSATKVISRMTGNEGASLGLHPAVYFYNENGKHSRFLFLGVIKTISDAIRNNNKIWFRKFTDSRAELERILVERKSLINQGLANINSRQRIARVANLISGLVETISDSLIKTKKLPKVTDNDILNLLGLSGTMGDLKIIDAPKGFSNETKSAVYLQESLQHALRCPECKGYLDTSKSVSYDHKIPQRDGGRGTIGNAQLMHPYCNTGIKS